MRKILGILLILVVILAAGCSSANPDENSNNVPSQAFVSGDFYPIATGLDLAQYFQEMKFKFNIDYEDHAEDLDGNFVYLGEEQDATGISLEFPPSESIWQYWLDDDGKIVEVLLNDQAVEVNDEAETPYNDFVLPFVTSERWIPPLIDVDTLVDYGWSTENKRTVIRNLGSGNINVDAFWFSSDSGDEYYFEVVKQGSFNIFVAYEVTEDDITYTYQLERLILR